MYLNPDAAREYLYACELSYHAGIIEFRELMQRLNTLYSLVPQNFYFGHQLNARINGFKKKFENENIEECFPESNVEVNIFVKNQEDTSVEPQCNTYDDFEDEEKIEFLTDTAGKVSKWEFHKGDADPYPSVPHGHATINDKIKLNPYSGKIFKGKIYKFQEEKKFIIYLWNNDKFRVFALEAIDHFIGKNPHHNFKMKDPRKIPSIRIGHF